MRIITYHDISNPPRFAEQIEYLHKRYQFISLSDIKENLRNQFSKMGRQHQIAITFDDAYPSVYHEAYPVLQKYNISATVFVITELVGTNKPYWWDEIPYYAPNDWSSTEKKAKVWEVKDWPNEQRIDYITTLKERSSKPVLTRKQLTWDQLSELQRSGWIIANHTHTHPMLNKCSREQMVKEVRECHRQLSKRGFTGGSYFAYPNGNASEETERVLRQEGIKLAFLFDHQLTKPSSAFRVSRLSMDTDASLFKTRLIVTGLHSKYMWAKKHLGI